MFKLIKWSIIFFIVYFIYSYFNPNFKNPEITNYKAKDAYEKKYQLQSYVDEKPNNNFLFKNTIINLLINSDKIKNENKNWINIVKDHIINQNWNYTKEIKNSQFAENELIEISELPKEKKEYSHNYVFNAKTKNKKNISGKINLEKRDNRYYFDLSFLDENKKIDIDKSYLFMDDSISETLTYKIVKILQEKNNQDIDPDLACKQYFGFNIEKIAGSISYHAAISYFATVYKLKSDAIDHSKVVNIYTNDDDSIFTSFNY